MRFKQWLINNSTIFNTYCIGLMALAISLSQVTVAYFQVSAVEDKNRYEELKTRPQIQVFRESNEEGDFIKVVNKGGEVFEVRASIYTLMVLQSNTRPEAKITEYFIPGVYNRPQLDLKNDNVILVAKSETSYEEDESQSLAFATKMLEAGTPAGASKSTFMELSYRDIFGKEYSRYYRILIPELEAAEFSGVKDVIEGILVTRKYPWLRKDGDVLYAYLEGEVRAHYQANKRVN